MAEGNLEDFIAELIQESVEESLALREEKAITPTTDTPHAEVPAVAQAKALQSLASSMEVVASFITQGGLAQLMTGQAKANMSSQMLNGLMTNMGRAALDASLMKQNTIEITQLAEMIFEKYAEKLKAKSDGNYDPELKNAEADFNERYSKVK